MESRVELPLELALVIGLIAEELGRPVIPAVAVGFG